MQTINIEGFGPMNFPNEMTQDEIKTAIDTKILPSIKDKNYDTNSLAGLRASREEESKRIQEEALRIAKEAAKPTPEGGFKAAFSGNIQQLGADVTRFGGRAAGALGLADPETFEASAQAREKTSAEIFKPTDDGFFESPWLKFKELAGGAAAYGVAPLVAGAVAGAAPVAGALGIGTGVAAALGAGLVSTAQFTGSNLTRQVKEDDLKLADTNFMAAGAAAVPQALLDIVSFRMMPGINRIFKSAGKELTEDQLKAIAQRNLLTNVGMRGGKVAGVEGLTEVGQQFLERLQAGISTTDAGAREEYLDSLIGGAVLGGVFGGVAGVGARGRAQRELGAREAKAAQEEVAKTEYNTRTGNAEQLNLLPDEMQGPTAPITAPTPNAAESIKPTAAGPESLPLNFGAQRQTELEQTFGSQAPDLLGDIVPTRGVASEVDPIEVRTKQLTQEFIDAGVPPREAGVAAFKQARNEQRDDTLAEMQNGAGAGSRQGALQFAPAASALTPQNASLTQMQREMGYTAAEQQREAQKRTELDKIAQQANIQRDLTDAGLTETPKGAAPVSSIQAGQPTQQQQLDLFSRKQAPVPSRAEGIRQGVGTQANEQAPAQPAATVDKAAVDFLYLPAASTVRQNILGKDLADPIQRTYVADQLKAARTAFAAQNDPRSRTAVKRINDILTQSPFVRTQGEILGPRGGVLEPQAQPKATTPAATTPAATTPAPRPAATPAATTPAPRPAATPPRDVFASMAQQFVLGEPIAAKSTATSADAPADTPTAKSGVKSPFDLSIGKVSPLAKDSDDMAGYSGRRKKLKLEESLGEAVPNDVQSLLQAGDLVGALNTLAAQTPGALGGITRALSHTIVETKIKVVDNLKDEAGNAIPGAFDPTTNTITLDSKAGLTNHAVLHETSHAAVSHVLDNPSHPVTKQLTSLFNKVKPFLNSVYGATNVQEFTAEAWSNTAFRAKLAGINPDGTNITALQKFTNIIKNFVRRLAGGETKNIESAMDQVDALMESIISSAPESRVSEALYMASASGTGSTVMNRLVNGVINNIPYTSNQVKNKIHLGVTTTLPRGVQGAILTTLPLPAFAEVASVNNTLPQAAQLNSIVQKHEGRMDARLKSISEVNNTGLEWYEKQSKAAQDNFNSVANAASRISVDLYDPKARDAFLKDPVALKEFDALKADFNKFDAATNTIYKSVLKTYKDLRDVAVNSLTNVLKTSITTPANANNVSNIIAKLVTQMGDIKGYIPFERRGEYRLSYELPGKNGPIVEQFETPGDRAEAIADAKANGATFIQEFSKLSEYTSKNSPPGSFVNTLIDTLNINKVPQPVVDKIVEQYINLLPEKSFAQGFRKRKGTLGFNENVFDVFSRKPYSFARQVTNMETSGQVRALLSKAREHINATGATEGGRKFLTEFERHANFAMNPDVANWSNLATTATFGMTLGANISSSVINTTIIPMIVGPYLAGQYGPGASMQAIGAAGRAFLGSGTTHVVNGNTVKSGFSVANYDFSVLNLDPKIKRLETLVRRGEETGQFGRSLTKDILDTGTGGNTLAKVNAAMGYFMHHTERMNRQVTMVAAYNLELDRLTDNPKPAERGLSQQAKEDLAFDKSLSTTELLHGGTSAMASPSIAQGSIGRIAFMYKRYGVTQYYMLFKTAKDALQNADPEVRSQARQQLGWVAGSTTLMAGVRGAPLYGVVRLLHDMFTEDDEDNFDTVMRKFTGDTAYGGLFNAVTGLEIGSRAGLTDLIFRPAQSSSADKETALDMAVEFIGGPAYGTAKRLIRGASVINDGHFARGLEQMLPAALSGPLKAIRYGTEGATTLRGDPIVDEISAWNVGAQAFGFAPAEYTRQLEINANEKGISRYQTEYRTKLMDKFYLATRLGDSESASDIMEQIGKWNAKHPSKGVAITADSIRDSMKNHMKQATMMRGGINISKARMPEFIRSMQEYESD